MVFLVHSFIVLADTSQPSFYCRAPSRLLLLLWLFVNGSILGLFIFPVFTVLSSIILGWLRIKTGSVCSASLAHAATNAIGGGLTILLFMGAPNWVFVGYTGILSWIPLGALCAWIILTRQLAPENKRI
jgi:hypothetical protein